MSSTQVSKRLPKPLLRGHWAKSIKMHLGICAVLAISTGLAYKHFVGDARRKRYAEFYRTYDAEKDYQRMKALGLYDDPWQDSDE